MLRLENIPPSEMPEVVHIAAELYERDKQQEAETQERQATVDAAAEVGIPEEYLHQAAAQLHSRRVAQIQQKRRRRTGIMAVVGTVLVLGTGAFVVTHYNELLPPTPPPITVNQSMSVMPFNATNWKVAANKGTAATVNYQNGSATLHVDRFALDAAGHYMANLNSSNGRVNLSNGRTISFQVRGSLPKVRLYLENGNERWRAPELAVTGQEQLVRINLNQFEHQTRTDTSSAWRKIDYSAPEWVDNLSFKTGWFVNDIGASGDLTLSDINIVQ